MKPSEPIFTLPPTAVTPAIICPRCRWTPQDVGANPETTVLLVNPAPAEPCHYALLNVE